MNRSHHRPSGLALPALWLASAFLTSPSFATAPGDILSGYTAASGVPASAARGKEFFSNRHGREWSCSSCHGVSAGQPGKHASTGKTIAPLAPAFNPERFTDTAKTEKWFRRNCKDVVGRECTPGEKADVLSWLLTLKS